MQTPDAPDQRDADPRDAEVVDPADAPDAVEPSTTGVVVDDEDEGGTARG